MKDVEPGSATFNQTYGDSYISGFVTGGEFTGIVSIKVIDRTKVSTTVNSIKSALAKSNEATELTFSPTDSIANNSLSSVMTGIESTISVAWMGGGQVKDREYTKQHSLDDMSDLPSASTPWDLQSVLVAAAAFPANVAECPQRTWAILTKYKANRSFVETSTNSIAKMLEYDQIHSYTAELFDHYMDYKLLLKHLQTIIDDRDSYQMRTGVMDALDVNLETLLSVKAVLRHEQSKIVQAVGILSKDPAALQRQAPTFNISQSTAVQNILAAQGLGPQVGQIQIAASISTPSSSTDEETVLVENSEPSLAGNAKVHAPDFNFASLIAPEIWENVMPVEKPSAQSQSIGASPAGSSTVLAGFRLPPQVGDDHQYPAVTERRAIQGMEDDLAQLRKEVQDAKQAAADATARAEEAERARTVANTDFQSQLAEAEYKSTNLNNQLADAKKDADAARSAASNVGVDLAEKKQKLDAAIADIASLKSTIALREKEVNDRNSQINQLSAQSTSLMNQILPPEQTRDDINILAMSYENWFWDINNNTTNTRTRLQDKARRGEVFEINNSVMCEGQDPAYGKRKYATIIYRRGKTGPVKIMHGGEGDKRQFE